MIIIYVTCKNNKEAEKIAKHLLGKKLIACANIIASKSLYHWKSKLEKQVEAILLLKTTESKFEVIKAEIKKLNSYQIPCILKINAEANQKYLDWMTKEIRLY